MKITEKIESPLLSRTTITAIIGHTSKPTPNRREIKKQIASSLKTKEELVVIKHIYTSYGDTNSKIIANIYKTKENLKKTESKSLRKEKEEPKEEKPAKEKKEEAPKAEEKLENGKETSKE